MEGMNGYDIRHHGILGMRWGVRRYQNRDGTLTEEGKLRYAEADADTMLADLRGMETAERRLKTGAVAAGMAAVAGVAGTLFLKKKLDDARAAARLGSVVLSQLRVSNVEYMLK